MCIIYVWYYINNVQRQMAVINDENFNYPDQVNTSKFNLPAEKWTHYR